MVTLLLGFALVCVALALPSILPAHVAASIGRIAGRVFTLAAIGIGIWALWMMTGMTGASTDALFLVVSGAWLVGALVLYLVGRAFRDMMTGGDHQDRTTS